MWASSWCCVALLLTASVLAETSASTCKAGICYEANGLVDEEVDAKSTSILQTKSAQQELRNILSDAEENQINGGSVVSQEDVDNKYPWFVQFINIRTCTSFCGGALVAPGTIVTAAHCFFNEAHQHSNYRLADEDIRAVVGYAGPLNTDPQKFDFRSQACAYPSVLDNRLRKLGSIHRPVHYGVFRGFDIGLVHLQGESCNIYDQTVRMAGLNSEFYNKKQKWRLLGYGATQGETGVMSEYLKTLEAPVQAIGADGDCEFNGQGNPKRPLIICSQEKTGVEQGAAGDSGGPWTVEYSHLFGSASILVGVQSSGVRNRANVPYGMLVSVPWFQNWIASAIEKYDGCIPKQEKTKGNIENAFFDGFHEAGESQFCKYEDCEKCSNEETVRVHPDPRPDPQPDTCFNDKSCPRNPKCVGFADE